MMAIQDNHNPDLPDLQALLGALAATGTAILGGLKWWDSKKKSDAENKKSEEENAQKKEDWLINNAFEIVAQLRLEVERLRRELIEEKEAHNKIVDNLSNSLTSALSKIRDLEMTLARSGWTNDK